MRTFFSLLLLFISATGSSQTLITGQVKDARSNPLARISISLKDTYDGATTDSSGRFRFTTAEKGAHTLVASSVGYKPFEQQVTLGSKPIELVITLREEVSELKAVVISAGAFEAGDRKKATVLSSLDILTTASANADITGAIKTLPGAQQVGESEGLFVRGGTAGETKTFIDGTLVNNFFYSSVPNVAQRGRFSPWFIKGTVFSTGGYSALYGQALSSALILESVDMPDQSSANLGLSFLNASGGFQQLAKDKKSSWGVNYAYTNLKLAFALIKQKQQFFTVPTYHTGDANFRIKTSKTGIIKYYGYLSGNKLGFQEPSIDTLGFNDAFRLSNTNTYHNLNFRELIGGGWKLQAGLSYSNNRDRIQSELQDEAGNKADVEELEHKNFRLNSRSHYANSKVVLEKRLQGLSVFRFGSEYNFSQETGLFTTDNGRQFGGPLTEHTKALFAEGDVYVTNSLAAKIGSRLEHSALLQKWNWAPRLSLAYKTGKNSQASLAYGTFYQNPESRYLPAEADLHFSKATHYIAQYQKMTPERTLRAEVYHKKYSSLVKTGFRQGRQVALNNGGYGEAQGFDFFWRDKKSVKGLDYWISYSFLDTKRDFLDFPGSLRPSFAARHTGSVVLKKFAPKLKTQFNASYTYASGRPYYNIRPDATGNKSSIFDQGRTIDYNSLSLSLNYLPSIYKQGAGKFTVFVLSVTNVLNSVQVYGYKYSGSGHRKEAIVPPSKMFVFLGAFFSFGVDRTQDVINNNL